MEDNEAIINALTTVGELGDEDYIIAPTTHADNLEEAAPDLALVLRSSAATTAAKEFERLDEEALLVQRRFQQTASRANLSVFLTACLAAALLAIGSAVPEETEGVKWVLLAVGIVGTVSGALGVMWHFQLRQGHLLQRWMSNRARAETQRINYFDTVANSLGLIQGEGRKMLGPYQLEYFRRYQLDVQISYYGRRGKEHEQAADKTLNIGSRAIVIATITVGVSGILAANQIEFAALAGLGVIGAALASFASTKEAISQDSRNAERYARTRDALIILQGSLDEVRAAVASGSREALSLFVAAVHEQLSVENRQWLDAAESTQSALVKLAEALAGEIK